MIRIFLFLLMFPTYLAAQVCEITDSTSVATVTKHRPFLMSIQEFQDTLLHYARIQLVKQELGSQLENTVYVQRNGTNTKMDIYAQLESAELYRGIVQEECYRFIPRTGRNLTVILSGKVIPTTMPMLTMPKRPSTSNRYPFGKTEFLQFLPVIALYIVVLL